MSESRAWRRDFAVRGIFWRRCIDWIVENVPEFLHPPLVWLATFIFFFYAAPARRTVQRHLGVIFPGSSKLANLGRAFCVFRNFAWMLTDSAAHRLLRARFSYELIGEQFLKELSEAKGAIILTAHMGSYDLGAALFAEKFRREMHIVRAPEEDAASAEHVDLALQQAGAGALKVDYSNEGSSLSLDLLNALRRGEIICIQGDRVLGNVSTSEAEIFARKIALPNGPFVLALLAPAPIYPLFVVRAGYRKYRIIAREPILCRRTEKSRDDDIEPAMAKWCYVLEEIITQYWSQWHAFTPVFRN